MSLINSALREMDTRPGTTMNVPARHAAPEPSPYKQILFALLGLCAVLATAALIWLWVKPQKMDTSLPQHRAAASTSLPVAAVRATQPEATASQQIATSAANLPDQISTSPALAASPLVSPSASPATAVLRRQATPTATAFQKTAAANVVPKPLLSSNTNMTKSKTPAATEASVAEVPLEKRLSSFLLAVHKNDMPAALEQLKAVQQQTASGNLSRMRAEGWYALRTGDMQAARRSYADILERFPDDEEASINLASMEARANRRESARQLLADALRSHPDSEALRDALNRFKAPTGN